MARVKRGTTTKARHKRVFAKTKGFKHGRKNLIRLAKQASVKAAKNAYIGRKLKKRNMRALWIVRLNAACRLNGISYSKFIKALYDKEIEINRKELADMAMKDSGKFQELVKKATA